MSHTFGILCAGPLGRAASSGARDSSVLVTGRHAGRRDSHSSHGCGFFSLPPGPDRLWGPNSFISSESRWLFLMVKRPQREAYAFPPIAVVKNMCSVSPCHFIRQGLITSSYRDAIAFHICPWLLRRIRSSHVLNPFGLGARDDLR